MKNVENNFAELSENEAIESSGGSVGNDEIVILVPPEEYWITLKLIQMLLF